MIQSNHEQSEGVGMNCIFRHWVMDNTEAKGSLVRVQTFSALINHILLRKGDDVRGMKVLYPHNSSFISQCLYM